MAITSRPRKECTENSLSWIGQEGSLNTILHLKKQRLFDFVMLVFSLSLIR